MKTSKKEEKAPILKRTKDSEKLCRALLRLFCQGVEDGYMHEKNYYKNFLIA